MLWNRCLGYKGSLKDIAVQRLGLRLWNTDVDERTESLSNVTKKCFPTYKKTIREEIKFILNEKPGTIDQVILWMGDTKKMNSREKRYSYLYRRSITLQRIKTLLGDPLRVIEMPPEALALSDPEKEEIRQNVYSSKVTFSKNWKKD
jgi:hypothetical protein